MSTTVETRSTRAKSQSLWSSPVFSAHIIALALHLPLMAVYFRELWSQPHYQSFFVFALVFVAVYVYWRVSESKQLVVSTRGILANTFLALAIPFSLFASLVFDPDFAAMGCFFVAASLFARMRDRTTDSSLLPAVWALATVVRLPFKLDILLITRLQIWTSKLASALLDLIGVSHILAGNVIRVGDKPFGVEEACSGIQSLFLMIFCAIAWSVFAGRGFMRMVLLTAAAVFWAAMFNVIRVTSICVAEAWYGIDLATGIQHAMIGYVAIGLCILMLVSTDYLLELFFGRQETVKEAEGAKPSLWARLGLVRSPENAVDSGAVAIKAVKATPWRRWVIVAVCAILGVVSLTPIWFVGPAVIWRQLSDKYTIHDITGEAIDETFKIKVDEASAFQGVEFEWKVEKFLLEERELNSDWGSKSSIWQLNGKLKNTEIACSLSCDYPFSGWHELTRCYRGNGWALESRINIKPKLNPEWPVTAVYLNQPPGRHAVLLFSLFEESGEPVLPPEGDIVTMSLLERAVNAIRQRVTKDYGPTPQTYQVQVFFPTKYKLPDEFLEIMANQFAEMREQIRQGTVAEKKN